MMLWSRLTVQEQNMILYKLLNNLLNSDQGPDSSVGIATRYVLEGPEIESRWGRDFPHPSRPASCTMGTGSLYRG